MARITAGGHRCSMPRETSGRKQKRRNGTKPTARAHPFIKNQATTGPVLRTTNETNEPDGEHRSTRRLMSAVQYPGLVDGKCGITVFKKIKPRRPTTCIRKKKKRKKKFGGCGWDATADLR